MASLLNVGRGLVNHKFLPYDYEVEYLESSGTQRIDTGIFPRSDFQKMELSARIQFVNTSKRQLQGAGDRFYYGVNNNKWEMRWGSYYGTADTYIHNLSKSIDINGIEEFYLDKVLINTYTQKYTDTAIRNNIFIYSATGTPTDAYFARIYSATIYYNDAPVRDFIPVVKDGVGCFYDKVSKTFFYNAGTGDFILGPRVS